MGILQAISNATSGVFADQWKDIYTAGAFDEHTVVAPGVLKGTNRGRGSNVRGSDGVISSGSKIYVPENTAAFVFSQAGIETVVTTPGGYEYRDGEESIFNNGQVLSLLSQVADRVGYGGISVNEKRLAFVNMREIRAIPFGTHGPQVYNDMYYKCDLEIYAYGTFSIKVTDAQTFIRNFVPAGVFNYSLDFPAARAQLLSEFLQSFIVALNGLSKTYRVSQLPSQAKEIAEGVTGDANYVGTWPDRFGFELVKVGIENIEFSEDSRQLVKQFSANRMSVSAFEESSQQASNIAAQQKIAHGIEANGLGDGGGMVFGMNVARGLNAQTAQVSVDSVAGGAGAGVQMGAQAVQAAQPAAQPAQMSIDEQIESVKKLKELLDIGVLSQEEFDIKKKEIMGF
jgi:membrane protease subunit (stomatin/prohibitin family)